MYKYVLSSVLDVYIVKYMQNIKYKNTLIWLSIRVFYYANFPYKILFCIIYPPFHISLLYVIHFVYTIFKYF